MDCRSISIKQINAQDFSYFMLMLTLFFLGGSTLVSYRSVFQKDIASKWR